MSPPRARKSSAVQPDSNSSVSEREIAVPRADDAFDGRAAEAMAAEDAPMGLDSLNERIRQRAYELYCARETPDGDAVEDWLEAERQILSAHAATEGTAPQRLDVSGDESASDVRSPRTT